MKKLLIPICLIISIHLTAQEDDGYVMYQTIQLKAKSGHQMDLREGLKAHNEKFHTEGSEAVSVWNIRSGPGGLSWVKGPMTWSSLDTPLTEDHRADWQKNVAAHADVGEFGYWKLVDGDSNGARHECNWDGYSPGDLFEETGADCGGDDFFEFGR